jgi:murein DD-endopeptidase MepM/ murein hydrolase activator NlpD
MDSSRSLREITPLARAAAIAVLALSGGVAAFATIAPEVPAPPATAAHVEPVALRAAPAVLPDAGSYRREERFQRGDTLAGVLERLAVPAADAQKLARLPALRFLRPGHTLAAEIDPDGALMRLSYVGARDTLTVIERAGSGFRTQQAAAPVRTETVMRNGVIRVSLFAAADEAGVPDTVAMQLADIFSGDLDFHRELRAGDRFAVVYEQHYYAGRPLRAGRVLAAEFVNQGRTLRAVHYVTAQGASGYYTPAGGNLRKAFLRSPVEFTRISSGFGMRRHPFQRTWRAHSGVDFAAPMGTRVRAAGDGLVEFAGFKPGYGNVVILQHRGQYSTVYAHLSRFFPGVRRGTRVAQGDFIGHVGQTGWATGPHLHYEFRIAGQSRNPYAIAMPAGLPVPAGELAAFRSQSEPLMAQLGLLADGAIALLE